MTRIIAGLARGRRLSVPAGTGTRPTGERAREGLFSSLQSLLELDGAHVLELYAGSGALGLEALSRGAAGATMVESDPAAVQVLERNAAHLALPGARVVHAGVERFLSAGAEPRYDLALLDPPYAHEVLDVLRELRPWLTDAAVVVVERSVRTGQLAWPTGYDPVRSRRYGEAVLWYATSASVPAR